MDMDTYTDCVLGILLRLLVELGLSSDEDDEIMNARASPSVHRSFGIDASVFSRGIGTRAVASEPSRFFARVVSSSSRVTLIPRAAPSRPVVVVVKRESRRRARTREVIDRRDRKR